MSCLGRCRWICSEPDLYQNLRQNFDKIAVALIC